MSVADDLRALRKQATPGPWLRLMHNRVFIRPDDRTEELVANCIFGDDAEFIAAAANLWPLLCNLVEAAEYQAHDHPNDTELGLMAALAALAQAAAK